MTWQMGLAAFLGGLVGAAAADLVDRVRGWQGRRNAAARRRLMTAAEDRAEQARVGFEQAARRVVGVFEQSHAPYSPRDEVATAVMVEWPALHVALHELLDADARRKAEQPGARR